MDKIYFLFFISTTLKFKKKAQFLYELLNRKLSHTTIYLLYAEPQLATPFVIQNHEITVKCGCHYEDLVEKTMAMFHLVNTLFPNISGIFKCNDNILPNIPAMQRFIKNISSSITNKQPIDYCGVLNKTHSDKNYRYTDHFGKCNDSKKNAMNIVLPKNISYAMNALYYVSKSAIDTFCKTKPTLFFYDDVMVAHHLLQANIVPKSMEFFNDNIDNIFRTNIVNHGNNTFKTLYIHLHGDLGQRMFQTAAAYGIAKHNRMYLTFVDDSEYDIFKRLFLKDFPCVDYSKIENIISESYPMTESVGYMNIIPEAVIATNRDVFMHGYFNNNQYFSHCSFDIFSLFHTPLKVSKHVLEKRGISRGFKSVSRYSSGSNITDSNSNNSQYIRGSFKMDEDVPSFEKSFFIYISETQTNAFLSKAISYIHEYETHPYFYILSHFDDDETIAQFDALYPLEKTIITIQSNGNNTDKYNSNKSTFSELSCQSSSNCCDNNLVDALAIMSLCKKGGITSTKDPISWWGGFLNDNIRKIIIHESESDVLGRNGIFII